MATESGERGREARGWRRRARRPGPVRTFFQRFAVAIERASWPAILIWLAVLFAAGGASLGVLEAPESGFQSLDDYTWWFLVTVTTVGYGDMAPATPAGRAVAAVVMVLGVGTIGVVLGKLGEMVLNMGSKRRRGMAQYHERDHIVLFGYKEEETQLIVDEIRADADWGDHTIVLCSRDVEENPLPEEVRFVRGDLSSDEVLERACVADAGLVIIHRSEDMQTIVTALAVTAVNTDAHIVAHLENPENEKHLLRVSPNIECVVSLSVPLLVQAMQDPGVTRIVRALVSNLDRDVLYRARLPDDFGGCTFADLLDRLKRRHGAVALAIAEEGGDIHINPESEFAVRPGSHLYYVGSTRITPRSLAADFA